MISNSHVIIFFVVTILIYLVNMNIHGYFLVNDPPPSERDDGKNFLAYVSDDFKTKNEM